MKRKVFSLMMLCLFAFLGLANAQVTPRDGGLTATPDPMEMGYRPNGAWMRPFEVVLSTTGAAETVSAIETSNEDFFVIDAKVPTVVQATKPMTFTIDNNDAPAGPYSAEVVVWSNSRKAYIFNVSATTYDPIVADVWETAPTVSSSFSATFGADIYDNYLLPGDEPDGKDVVYKVNVANDVLFSATVEGENGKTAIYASDFGGQPGPGANNYMGGDGGPAGAPYEAVIGENGTTTTGYFPFYTLYNYSISENLFLADELAEAGLTPAPMGSLSWYANNETGKEQKNISIWMANVTDEVLSGTSVNTSGMTLVYTGDITPVIGWNEFLFNQESFAWDGSSNLLICVQRSNGEWNSTINWKAHNAGFTAMAYTYRDPSAYDMTAETYSLSTSSNRASIKFKSVGRDGKGMTAVIDGMTLTPGEYYLAASSTSEEFTLNVTMATIPVPEPVANPFPADGDTDITMPLTFTWDLGNYTTEYRMICGTSYPPTNVVVDWTSDLAESLTVNDLYNNTNYFWRIDERNSSGEVIGPIWGFTTSFNIPQNLAANPQRIYMGETLHLTWDQVDDRSYRGYNVYQDEVKINEELLTANNYDVTGLGYNMEGYTFNVTAVYDEGESNFSNDLVALVTGNGTVSGKISEQDGTTGIAGATVVFTGTDEFDAPATFTFTTSANGTYSGNVLAGTYHVMAWAEGYQAVEGEEDITVTYNQNTGNINFSLDENWNPVGEVIAEEVDENTVKVYWSQTIMSELIEDFETGDLSAFDWQNDASYPWVITNGGADSESQYCLKSGNAHVASSTSSIQVSVEISRDGLMSFYGKISCESNYDNGYFYIDGVQKASFTGAGNWAQREYPVTAGVHTFKWSYSKDSSVDSNDDCFYIDNISFVHDAAPAETGWITYEDGVNQDAIGLTAGGSFYWGICFPAAMMAQYGNFTMTKVKLFDHESHTGKVMIYKGGESAPGTLVTEQNYTCTGSENYVEVTLSNPVSIDASQSIWVVLTNNNGQYVASCCANTGDPNGRWISMDGIEWMDLLEAAATLDYTWQIQAYVTDGAKTAPLCKDVAAAPVNTPANQYVGKVSDLQGDPNWTKPANRAFNHYNIYRTSCYDMTGEEAEFIGSLNDTIYLEENWGTMAPGVYKWGVSRFYEGNRNRGRATYDFDDGTLQGWTNIDADGDGNVWTNWNSDGTVAHSGTGVAASESYINYVGALNPDNWLVSPQVTLSGNMTFWAAGQDPSYAAEHFAVYVSTTSNTNTSSFTQVMNETVATGTMTQYTVDLSSYAGQSGYVAIRHYNISDMFRLNVDDITIGAGGGDDPQPPTPPTPPVIPGGDMTYTGVHGESGVVWSNCLENKMYVSPTINVSTNSDDAVTGATVTLVNTSEPDLNLTYNVTLDETGTYTWESMRRGTYDLSINLSGFTPIAESVEITDGTVLNYRLTEVIDEVSGLYVSGTGWAMFGEMPAPTPVDPVDPPTPGEGQWYYYGTDINTNGIGAGGPFYWAVMFPAGTYTGNMVTKVATFATEYAFSGSVTIFNDGTSAPSNAVGTMDINVPGSESMYEMEFPTPVMIDPSKNLWVVMYNATSTTYPAAACDDAGDPNARWVSIDGTSWMDLGTAGVPGYSWILRAYIASGKGEVTEIAYEPQPCKNTGLVASGHGCRSLEYYKVMLDGVLEGTTTNPFFQHNVENLVEGETYTTSVQKVYSTGESEWVNFDWVYTSCENFEGLQSANSEWSGENVVLTWVLPEGGDIPTPPDDPDDPDDPSDNITADFESGTLGDWTTIDADGDGYEWIAWSSTESPAGHNGSTYTATSASYQGTPLFPDNYLVSPAITLGGTLHFWACAQDASWAAEHFGVALSTTNNTSASAFTMITEEFIMSAKGSGQPTSDTRSGNRVQGNWYEYTVDLSAYSGTGYIAIRHFNCSDWFRLNVDDITISSSKAGRSVSYDFEGSLQGWTTIDADANTNLNWYHSSNSINNSGYDYTGLGHNGSNGFAISQSYIDYDGAYQADNYLVSPQMFALQSGSNMTFWADNANDAYPDHFGVYVSTAATPTASSFTAVWQGNAKGAAGEKAAVRHSNNRYENWRQHTVDLSSYAGQTVWIAFRHNDYDMYEIWIDDVTINAEGGDGPTPPDDPTPATTLTWDFEADFAAQEILEWTTINANNDEYTWYVRPTGLESLGHNNSQGFVTSASYMSAPINVDDYLVSPQVTLGGTFSFWACAQDAAWPTEHFGVFVSTTGNTSGSDFTMIEEWDMTAKGTGAYTNDTKDGGREMGNWYQYTVDLSAYSGNGYIAIRHFNCSDWFRLNVDDIEYTVGGGDNPPTPGANIIGVEIFRDGEWIAEVKAPEQTYTDIAPGEVDLYEIRVVYNGNTEDYTYYTMSCPEILVPAEVECIAPENLTGSYEYLTNDYFGALLTWTYPEEIPADWYQYDDNTYATSVGASGPFQWAVMFPGGSYEGNTVTKVSTWDYLSNATVMNGSVSIWSGGSNAPQTQLASMPITFTGSQEELVYTFDEPVVVDPQQNLWVVFTNDDCSGYPAAAANDSGDPNGRWVGIDGAWYDLAAAGLPGYNWIIHCFIGEGLSFNVYRNNEVIATLPYIGENMTYFDQAPIGNYRYQVTAVSADCESDFALTPDESANYVDIFVTNVNEASSFTKLYPNPTNGNVKIEASGMTHLTVINTLGQIVYDTDIHGDMYELNMGQYDAGLYMVRISSENGISVKRVTLVK